MIVRRGVAALELITQPDHAHLARKVIAACGALTSHPRRASILKAVGEHDNGWTEEDASPAVDPQTGDVYDFIHAPAVVRQRVWPRAVLRLSADAWAAALVAQHALTAYDRFRQDPDWSVFFDAMTAQRNDMVRRATGHLDDLLDDYVFVRLGDLISLTFCLGSAGEQRFADYIIMPRGAGRIAVDPDPFDGRTVTLEVSGREIPSRAYASDGDLRAELGRARTFTLLGEVAGPA